MGWSQLLVVLHLSLLSHTVLCSVLIREPEPSRIFNTTTPTPRTEYFTARLHHFDATNTQQFDIKFYYQRNESAVTDNVLVLVGGPWAISPQWLMSSLVTDLANNLGQIATFYVEHRFYGDSLPNDDLGLHNLRFLSADQTLGDLAQFIQYIKSDAFENGIFSDAKVTLIGCSVGGTLSTWMRSGYPHLVDYVVADSSPLEATPMFTEYLPLVSERILNEGPEGCHWSIQSGITRVRALAETEGGRQRLADLFNTTVPQTERDFAVFYWFGIIEPIALLVQESDHQAIHDACEQIHANTGVGFEEILAILANEHRHPPGNFTSDYQSMVNNFRNINLASNYKDRRLWLFQACSQYGWYQAAPQTGMFMGTVPDDFFSTLCQDVFGPTFTEAFLNASMARTNVFFSGIYAVPDYVYSVTTDPWAPLSPWVQPDSPSSRPVNHIERYGQCQVIRPLAESEGDDHAVLHAAKLSVEAHLLHWIRDIELPNAAATLGHSLLTIVIGMGLFKLIN